MKQNILQRIGITACIFAAILTVCLLAGTARADASVSSQAGLKTALAGAASGDVITVSSGFDITEQLSVPTNVTLKGATLSRGAGYTGALFDVPTGSTLKLDGITIDGKSIDAKTAAVTVEGTLDVESSAVIKGCRNSAAEDVNDYKCGHGGAVFSGNGTVNIKGTVSGSYAYLGGGIYSNNGTLNVTGKIINNEADAGGGIYTYAVSGHTVDLNLSDMEISGNTAESSGGGIFEGEYTAAKMTSGKISGNSSKGDSGAVNVNSRSKLTMTGGEISGNTNVLSGAVSVDAGSTFDMSSGSIHDNTCTKGYCAALSVYSNSNAGSVATLSGDAKIYNNKSASFAGAIMVWGEETATLNIKDNAEIYGNSGTMGGAVNCNIQGLVNMSGGSIHDNSAILGGGVDVSNPAAVFNMTGGTIKNNNAILNSSGKYGHGGGVFINTGAFNMIQGTVTGNTSAGDGSAVYDADTFRLGEKAGVDGMIYLDKDCYVGLIGKAANRYNLATAKDDSADGRTVVKPDSYKYNGTTYSAADAEPYAGHFTHILKGVVKGSEESTYTTDTGNLVLGGHSVSFNLNTTGAASPAGLDPVVLKAGDLISGAIPKTSPSQKGYSFGGWYYDQGCTKAVAGSDVMGDSNIVLYAKWTAAAVPQAKSILLAKVNPKGSSQLKLKWTKVTGATKYVIYGSKCNFNGHKYSLKKMRTVSASKDTTLFRHLKKHTGYKFRVVACRGNTKLAQSYIIHNYTTKKLGRHDSIKTIKGVKKALTVSVGRTAKMKAKAVTYYGRTPIDTSHAKKLRFLSTDDSIAAVKNGKLVGVGRGTCKVYTMLINGSWSSTTVTVK